MKKPIKLVAIVSDISGGCKYVALVKNIDETEYAHLLYEQRQYERREREKINELFDRCKSLESQVKSLEKEIKVLKGEEENE